MKLPLPKPTIKMVKNNKKSSQNSSLEQSAQLFLNYTQQAKYHEAYDVIYPVYLQHQHNPSILMNLAFVELRLQDYEQAYQHYHQAILQSGSKVETNIYDGLAEVCYLLHKTDELRTIGQLAMQTKKDEVKHEPFLNIQDYSPEAFQRHSPEQNIIAFSLFGQLPRYCETAVLNVTLAKEIYPAWTCRFYVDDTVPEHVKQRLLQAGAQVQEITLEQKQLSGLFWRFLVMSDPTVKRFLIRDADSLVSYREKYAVDAWLNSNKCFHCMHDYFTHTELVLAGMWGGCTGIFSNIEQRIKDFIRSGRFLNQRVIDQHFLRYVVWPTLKQSVLIHDSQGFDVEAVDFPHGILQKDYEKFEKFHVGMNEGSSQMQVHFQNHDIHQFYWTLLNEQGDIICKYKADIVNQVGLIDIPRTYADYLQNKKWTIKTEAI